MKPLLISPLHKEGFISFFFKKKKNPLQLASAVLVCPTRYQKKKKKTLIRNTVFPMKNVSVSRNLPGSFLFLVISSNEEKKKKIVMGKVHPVMSHV